MKVLLRFHKRADIDKNRIIIPKFIIEKYGRDFYLEYCDDETIRLVPTKEEK